MENEDANSEISSLPYTVIRIRAGDLDFTETIHTGTGFFYGFKGESSDYNLIVSNKHVLVGKKWLEFDFATKDENGARAFGPPVTIRVQCEKLRIYSHPSPDVDLAAVPLTPLVKKVKERGKSAYALLLSKDNFPKESTEKILYAATNILMVGFPNAIMDNINNLPIIRKGTLATYYKADYLGKNDFVADIACFGGSSGSPVFAFFDHFIPDGKGGVRFNSANNIFFIGVLHSGPVMTARGDIIPAPIPTNHLAIQTNIMIHLGYCVKSYKIEEIFSVIKQSI